MKNRSHATVFVQHNFFSFVIFKSYSDSLENWFITCFISLQIKKPTSGTPGNVRVVTLTPVSPPSFVLSPPRTTGAADSESPRTSSPNSQILAPLSTDLQVRTNVLKSRRFSELLRYCTSCTIVFYCVPSRLKKACEIYPILILFNCKFFRIP